MKLESIVDPRDLETIHREILTPIFPPDELIPLEQLLGEVADGSTIVTAVRDAESGEIVAVAIGNWFAAARAMLLAYLAVRPGARGKGIGGPLLEETITLWHGRFAPRIVVAEVEHPGVHASDPARGDPVKRLRFYERAGARLLDLPYFQPSLFAGGNRVHGMLLLVLEVDASLVSADGSRLVDSSSLRGLLDGYSREFRRPAVDDSPELAAFLDAIDTEGGIRILPIAAYEEIAFPRGASQRNDEGGHVGRRDEIS